ncbi:male-specific sperm protein Mst84Dd isoform X2 [Culex quinquefasciatus]|uniref:male-specific sperm protein Mst84Dd isoform X2 n=1 Tax=Culex quinquefasciatus TaxID=7176 RepID=UPI0018E2C385|nr:male-specific sperm protein Mst84Dd isoform X2 [Culex quinquefasciatus]
MCDPCCSPCGPCGPVCGPCGPCGPACGPCGPCGPCAYPLRRIRSAIRNPTPRPKIPKTNWYCTPPNRCCPSVWRRQPCCYRAPCRAHCYNVDRYLNYCRRPMRSPMLSNYCCGPC